MKNPISTKHSNLESYVQDLKCLIIDSVCDYTKGILNADDMITEWFEINEPCSLKAWARMEAVSVKVLWGFMVNKVVIE
jgi:hypothetical protein